MLPRKNEQLKQAACCSLCSIEWAIIIAQKVDTLETARLLRALKKLQLILRSLKQLKYYEYE